MQANINSLYYSLLRDDRTAQSHSATDPLLIGATQPRVRFFRGATAQILRRLEEFFNHRQIDRTLGGSPAADQ